VSTAVMHQLRLIDMTKNDENPKLLSGGNPQIPKGDGREFVSAYLNGLPRWKQTVGRKLDELILKSVPNSKMAIRWNTPFYGIEGNGWFIAFHCLTKYMKVTFFRGTSLNPIPPESSKQENVRYFHIKEKDQIDEKLFTNWIEQASKIPGEKVF
jgi:hypothetical protein